MKKYRKALSLVLCLVLGLSGIFFATACKGDDEEEKTGGPNIADMFTTNETEDPYPQEVKVGFIYSGTASSDTFAAIFEVARFELQRTLGVETCYIENVRVQQFEDAVIKMQDDGCNVIVAASNHFNSAVVLAANEFTDLYFISFGGNDQAVNLASIQPLLYQPANIAGLIAAYNTGTNKIGMVVDNNLYHAYGIANSFALGVRELPNSQIDIYLNWALSDRYADTRASIDDLAEQDCDIIFVYQSEEYGIKRCEELGITVIGIAYNLPELAPQNYLTGMYMNLNTFIIDKVRNVMYGNFAAFGGLTRRGLNYGTVGLIAVNENIAKEGTIELAEALLGHVTESRSFVFNGEVRDQNDNIRVEKGEILQPHQIFNIRWLANIITREQNMSPSLSQGDLIFSDMIIKY